MIPASVVVDVADYQYEGKPMGDHYPLIATFTVTEGKTTSIDSPKQTAAVEMYDLQGCRVSEPSRGVYILNHRVVQK